MLPNLEVLDLKESALLVVKTLQTTTQDELNELASTLSESNIPCGCLVIPYYYDIFTLTKEELAQLGLQRIPNG